MSKIVFTLGAETFTFDADRSYPVDDPIGVTVVTDMSEGGQMYAYDKGVAEQFFNLSFNNASADDFANVADWLANHAVGPKNTFTYTDEAAATHTVRMLDVRNPLKKVGPNQYAGTIMLRKEIA